MELFRTHQLSIMLFLSGICAILALTTLFTNSMSQRRKSILALMEISAMVLLLSDRYAYIYRGNADDISYYMVRFSNGLVFFLTIFIPHLVTQYIKDVLEKEGELQKTPVCLRVCDFLFAAGTVLVIISQFTGLFYTFDEQNVYHRSAGYILCYIAPVLIVLLQEYVMIRNREILSRGLFLTLTISVSLPTVASVVQLFCYGVSLTTITLVLMAILFYIYALNDMGRKLETSRQNELESYKEAQRIESAMFEQTAEALANAIDAKDRYTHGHSTRVAMYSRNIAEKAGFSKKECDTVYFAALLHDVGKIGVKDEIINKVGRLTPEEFEEIKLHTILGDQILSSIKQSPALSIGARYHHERYDGKGYPVGLSGEDIPEIARIIAVADAYDAMTSNRSYRSSLPMEKVRQELIDGTGKQFDPKYAGIMLDIIDKS